MFGDVFHYGSCSAMSICLKLGLPVVISRITGGRFTGGRVYRFSLSGGHSSSLLFLRDLVVGSGLGEAILGEEGVGCCTWCLVAGPSWAGGSEGGCVTRDVTSGSGDLGGRVRGRIFLVFFVRENLKHVFIVWRSSSFSSFLRCLSWWSGSGFLNNILVVQHCQVLERCRSHLSCIFYLLPDLNGYSVVSATSYQRYINCCFISGITVLPVLSLRSTS